MSGIMEGVAGILSSYTDPLALQNLSFEHLEMTKTCVEGLKISDMYEIDTALSDFVNQQKDDAFVGKMMDEIRAPADARPPSETCFLYSPNSDSGFLTIKHKAGDHSMTPLPCVTVVRMCDKLAPIPVGVYAITDQEENNELFVSKAKIYTKSNDEPLMINALLHVSLLFSLINQPRFVVRDAAGSRQSRKHMQRKHGISTGAWHKIEWNLGEPVKAKRDSDKGGWRMPLHYTRGHWRKAQEHWDDVVIRKDNQPYKWIDGFWSGHPAYGVKKSYHAPKLGKKEVGQ